MQPFKIVSMPLLLAVTFLIGACQSPDDPSTAERVVNDIVERVGVFYAPFESVPYTGRLERYWNDGRMIEEGRFLEGKREGIHTTYTTDGKVLTRFTYLDGIRQGPAQWGVMRTTGWVTTEGNFVNDKEHGSAVGRYENGQKAEEGVFVNGQADGVWTHWDQAGNRTDEFCHRNGDVVGIASCR